MNERGNNMKKLLLSLTVALLLTLFAVPVCAAEDALSAQLTDSVAALAADNGEAAIAPSGAVEPAGSFTDSYNRSVNFVKKNYTKYTGGIYYCLGELNDTQSYVIAYEPNTGLMYGFAEEWNGSVLSAVLSIDGSGSPYYTLFEYKFSNGTKYQAESYIYPAKYYPNDIIGMAGPHSYYSDAPADFDDSMKYGMTFDVRAALCCAEAFNLNHIPGVNVADFGFTNFYYDVCNSEKFYFDAVYWACRCDITKGTATNVFSPDMACTRAQCVTFLYRASGSPSVAGYANPYKDVKPGSYYYNAVLWANHEGITKGTTATTFSPDNLCSRGEIVTLLYRASGEKSVSGYSNPFKDVGSSAYYYKAVLWANHWKITTGTDAYHFSPNTTCNRAQIVTFLYRCIG